jgi:transglutaminase-like putative cysteine protease
LSTATEFLNDVQTPPSLDGAGSVGESTESLGNWVTRFAPVYDWVSLVIIVWMMVMVGWSVQLAGWGDLPSVIPTLLMGTFAAFVVSKMQFNWYLTIVYWIGLGFFVVMWQGTAQAVGGDPISRSIDGYGRFFAWIDTAQSGGISTDTVPFALMFIAASWIVGYGVTALTFRFRSPWLPTVLLSLVILTNLSYRHGEHEYTFFLFLVGGITLFAHLTTVRRIERWASEGIEYSRKLAWATVQDGLILALPIVLISAFLPVWEPRSEQVHDAWDVFRAPFYALQDPANRLLAGVDGPGGGELLSTPSQTMAFGGSISLTQEPLMWVRSKYIVPHAGRVYQRYTSEGWLTDSSIVVDAPPRSALTLSPTELERERVAQVYVPLVDTKAVVPAGGVFSVDRETKVQVLNPIRWDVPLSGSVAKISQIPPDLRDLVFAIRFALNDLVPVESFQQTRLNNQRLAPPELVEEVIQGLSTAGLTGDEQIITRTVIDDAGVVEKFETVLLPLTGTGTDINWAELSVETVLESDTGLVAGLEIERVSPIEQVGVQLADEISKDDSFSVQTFISLATDEQLNEAGSDYPTWVSDRYLQLPESLPDEVRVLASEIVRSANAVTPFEKAEAVKAFLKDQEYSLEIEGPEFGTDGIYYFLFETQNEPCASTDNDCHPDKIKGYSQYFGSSGAVLLRAVGVPARFVAGWAAGEYIPEAGLFLVRDKDRHGWSQVYFPEYGWVEYEMTPGQLVTTRGELAPSITGGDPFAAGAVGSAEENPDFMTDIADLERLAAEARNSIEVTTVGEDGAGDQFVIPWRPLAWVGGAIGSVLLVMFLWWFSLRGMDAPTKAYARMNRMASLLGMRRRPNQTAVEFAADLGEHTIAASEHAAFIATEYQRQVYAGDSHVVVEPEDGQPSLSKRLDGAWRRVARALIARRIRQLGGIGPELGEGRGE